VARVWLAPGVYEDLDRILEHLHQYDATDGESRMNQILSALDVLADNPLIGRRGSDDRWELMIGRDARGYVALYRYIDALDTVIVLSLRAQKEAGYARP
jgi:toxin ParE1/3/4